MKKFKKIWVIMTGLFLMFYSKCYADTIDPGEYPRRHSQGGGSSETFIDIEQVFKFTIIGILIVLLIAIVAVTIYKIVKSKKEL